MRRPPGSTCAETCLPYTPLDRSPRLVGVSLDRVGNLLLREAPEVVRLAQHRAKAAHLPHQPLQRLVARPRVLRQQLAGLFRQVDEDGAALEQRSEEHTSELQSLMRISYAVFCLKKKKYTQISEIR